MNTAFIASIIIMGSLIIAPHTVEARNNHNNYHHNRSHNDVMVGTLSGLTVGTLLGYSLAQPRYERVHPYYVPMQTRQPICQNYNESVIINGFYYEHPRTACLNDYNEWIVVR